MDHIEQIQRLVPGMLKGKVLDVGSGRGSFLRQVRAHGGTAVGLEPYQPYVDQTKNDFTVVQGTGEHMPFEDNSFDFLNVSEVTEHCEDPDQLLREIRRVLAPGGAAYISFTNRFAIKDPHFHLWLVNWLPRAWCERFISLFGSHKNYENTAGRQRLSQMHYYTYFGARKAVLQAGLRPVDPRLTKLSKTLWPLYLALAPLYVNSHHLYAFKNK